MATIIKILVPTIVLLMAPAFPSVALNANAQLPAALQLQDEQNAQVLTVRTHRRSASRPRGYRGNQYGRGFDYQYQRN